jgi:hypothetical protein
MNDSLPPRFSASGNLSSTFRVEMDHFNVAHWTKGFPADDNKSAPTLHISRREFFQFSPTTQQNILDIFSEIVQKLPASDPRLVRLISILQAERVRASHHFLKPTTRDD